jgi:serine protease AprX
MPKDRRSTSSRRSSRQAQPQTNPEEKPFTPETLDRTTIAIPLLDKLTHAASEDAFEVIIDVNLDYPGGREAARTEVAKWVNALPDVMASASKHGSDKLGINEGKGRFSQQYLFGRLSAADIRRLVIRSQDERKKTKDAQGRLGPSALYRIWLDHEVTRFTNASISTVKADAARNAFNTTGKNIVWAVVDTGIDTRHPHFKKYRNLELAVPLLHRDFTSDGTDQELKERACRDVAGHGTHVAGIIAGRCFGEAGSEIVATVRRRDENGDVIPEELRDIPEMSGMAPQCKLLSLKVLNDKGKGHASNLIAALEYINNLNGGGRRVRIHGVNMSVGYDFEPKWFACGQSPLCVEVDRLVRSGVVVVVAAGNTGYGFNQSLAQGPVPAGQDVTINDPGNADLAITVGSTHRDMPHVYGVSYFSSKGPTGDGRLKPDIVAPGEKIISCQSGDAGPQGEAPSTDAAPADATPAGAPPTDAAPAGAPPVGASQPPPANQRLIARYKEDSGTSMAAPHVSGVIAAFLSVRPEFIGKPETVKQIFMSTATDLRRAVYFQGKGLVDLMRAIQSV